MWASVPENTVECALEEGGKSRLCSYGWKAILNSSMEPTVLQTSPLQASNDPIVGAIPSTLGAIDWSLYDFIDFGCSSGGSLQHCAKRFNATRGLGIDIDGKKVTEARKKGLHAIAADITDIPGNKVVRFASMMQTLEHLSDLKKVEATITRASELATDFLYIHHPSFEDEHYLRANGLHLYYHNWSGHPCHALRTELFRIFEKLDLLTYHVRPLMPIVDSSHPSVLPLGVPKNQHEYSEEIHGPKLFVRFDRPIYQHVEMFVLLRPMETQAWRKIVHGR
jgi:SAM-dependent methyltransferase